MYNKNIINVNFIYKQFYIYIYSIKIIFYFSISLIF